MPYAAHARPNDSCVNPLFPFPAIRVQAGGKQPDRAGSKLVAGEASAPAGAGAEPGADADEVEFQLLELETQRQAMAEEEDRRRAERTQQDLRIVRGASRGFIFCRAGVCISPRLFSNSLSPRLCAPIRAG